MATSAGAGVLLVVFLVLAIAFPLALSVLVDREAENTTRMDRSVAERAVRRDTDADGSDDRSSDAEERWGTDDSWGSDGKERPGQ
jgi:hypothetical protein